MRVEVVQQVLKGTVGQLGVVIEEQHQFGVEQLRGEPAPTCTPEISVEQAQLDPRILGGERRQRRPARRLRVVSDHQHPKRSMRAQGRANRSGHALATGAGEDHHGHPWACDSSPPSGSTSGSPSGSSSAGVSFTGGAVPRGRRGRSEASILVTG